MKKVAIPFLLSHATTNSLCDTEPIKFDSTKYLNYSLPYSDHLPQLPEPYINPNKIGRNDLCSCGSGKKYKKCCL